MKLKATAYKQYGEAAKLSLVLENMPKIARAVAAPLSKTENIVLLGDDRTTTEVTKLVSNLPPAVQALTGIDLKEVIYKAFFLYRTSDNMFLSIADTQSTGKNGVIVRLLQKIFSYFSFFILSYSQFKLNYCFFET